MRICVHQAIYEEVAEEAGHNSPKLRQFQGLVTAEKPYYLSKYAENAADQEMVAPAICGEWRQVAVSPQGAFEFCWCAAMHQQLKCPWPPAFTTTQGSVDMRV